MVCGIDRKKGIEERLSSSGVVSGHIPELQHYLTDPCLIWWRTGPTDSGDEYSIRSWCFSGPELEVSVNLGSLKWLFGRSVVWLLNELPHGSIICLASSSACGQDITLAADRVPSRLDFPLRFHRRINDQSYCWCYSISWQRVLSWNESVCWSSSAGWDNLCFRDSIAAHRIQIGCEILSWFGQVDAMYSDRNLVYSKVWYR